MPGDRTIIELTPAKNSVQDVQKKIDELYAAMNPFSENVLLRLVQGAVAPQVNVGVLSIYNNFLVKYKDEVSLEDQEMLRLKFDEFFQVCRNALRLLKNPKLSETRDMLVDYFNSLLDRVDEAMKEKYIIVKEDLYQELD